MKTKQSKTKARTKAGRAASLRSGTLVRRPVNARYYIITPKEKPPLGLMGGSVHDYERGKDPFARECMPPEFQDRFPDKPAATGWLALDWCGNVIAFAQDGHRLILSSPNAKAQP